MIRALAAALLLAGAAHAQDGAPALPERALGSPDAPVELVEYASLSCPHCAAFHAGALPEIRERFIDTGRVRYVYRDFPLDRPALLGAMVAQCQAGDRFFPVLDTLFRRQDDWARHRDPEETKEAIAGLLRQFGITRGDISACLAETPENQARMRAILEGRLDASNRLGVESTPSFLVDGEMVEGPFDADRLAELVE